MAVGEGLEDMRFLIRDCGGWFAAFFDVVFEDCGLWILCSAPRAPGAIAICERLVGTLRREVLDHVLMLSEARLRIVLGEYAEHYSAARPYRGVSLRVPDDEPDQPSARIIDLESARIRRRPVLGGLTSEYQVAA